jgi:hypothetical protein
MTNASVAHGVPRDASVPHATDAIPLPHAVGRRPARVGLVGSGWRAEFYVRVAGLLPAHSRITGVVVRTAERGDEVESTWDVPAVRSIADLIELEPPDYVVVAVPWDVTPSVIRDLVRADLPVLAETPPAPTMESLRELWTDVAPSGLVQVAEHSLFLPAHAARLAVLRSDAIGQVTQVQISSTHMYHAMALIRAMLGVGHDPATITARRFTAPLVDPFTREGWTGNELPQPAGNTIGLLDFDGDRSAVYDFSDNQWLNPLRVNRLLVRGSFGELLDNRVTQLTDARTVVTSELVRRQSGIEQDLEGFDLDHISFQGAVVYRNAFQGARLSDEDVAVASLMDAMASWTRNEGPAPYPLAQGSQDHALALAVEDAVRTGGTVSTVVEPWADAL